MASKKQTPEVPTVPTPETPATDTPKDAQSSDPEPYCPLCEEDFDDECTFDNEPISVNFYNCTGFTVNIYNSKADESSSVF
jgi:hypothetical protein